MSTKHNWLWKDERTLVLSGYDIRIHRVPSGESDMPFKLICEGRSLPYFTLKSAMIDGQRRADEIDELDLHSDD